MEKDRAVRCDFKGLRDGYGPPWRRIEPEIALVRNVCELDAGHGRETFGAEMDAAACAGGGIIEFAGLRLRERDQLANGMDRQRRMHANDERAGGDEADRREIPARIVADIVVERRIDRERAGAAEPECVAVGRCLGDLTGGDAAARAAAILDDDLLAERLAHLLGG